LPFFPDDAIIENKELVNMIFKSIITFFILSCALLSPRAPLYAEEAQPEAQVYFNNGDRISGKVVFEDGDSIKVESEFVGAVSINKEMVKEIVYGNQNKTSAPDKDKSEEKEKPGLWSGDASAGYDKSGGNTNKADLALRLLLNRKTADNEFTVKGEMFYSSASDKMDAQKWYNMFRYAYSFHERKWYNFYKVENDHDRFANISWRLLPSLGTGYWFFNSPDFKLVLEFGLGWEHTEFRREARDRDEAVFLPRAMFEKALFAKSRITQELSLYPYLTQPGEYRLRSETAFTNPLSDRLSLRLSFTDDYYSDPTGDAKKNDYRFISALSYSF